MISTSATRRRDAATLAAEEWILRSSQPVSADRVGSPRPTWLNQGTYDILSRIIERSAPMP